MKHEPIESSTIQHEENIQSYFRLRLENHFKPQHPIQKVASLLFPPLGMLKDMFSNIQYGNHLPMHYPPNFPQHDESFLSVPILWQILIYNIAYPQNHNFEANASWRAAICSRLTYRHQMEQLFYDEATHQSQKNLLKTLKSRTLIDHQVIDAALEENSSFNLWRLQIHAHTDFYLSLISTFDQAVTEDVIIFCAEENITLPSEFTELTDSGFIGQILPTLGKTRPVLPDNHLLNLFHLRENVGAYFYDACQLAEKIGSHDIDNSLLGHLTHCRQIRCNDWRDWLAQSGNCSKKDIPPLLLDLFFLSRAMSKFIQYQNKQLKLLGVVNSEEETIAIYQRYPLYFNQPETFQGEIK